MTIKIIIREARESKVERERKKVDRATQERMILREMQRIEKFVASGQVFVR